MSTALDLDLAALVGELEDVACEHKRHGRDATEHDGPATYYVSAGCPSCDGDKNVYAACQRFIDTFMRASAFSCPRCYRIGDPSEFVTILGPVNGRAS